VDPTDIPQGIYLVSRPAVAKPACRHFAVFLWGEWEMNLAQNGCYYPIVAELNSTGIQVDWHEGGFWTVHFQVAPEEELQVLWRLERTCAADPDYALWDRNCEQFARWITTGVWESKQLQTVGVLAAVAAFGFLATRTETRGRRIG
jgi:hypothetical protein